MPTRKSGQPSSVSSLKVIISKHCASRHSLSWFYLIHSGLLIWWQAREDDCSIYYLSFRCIVALPGVGNKTPKNTYTHTHGSFDRGWWWNKRAPTWNHHHLQFLWLRTACALLLRVLFFTRAVESLYLRYKRSQMFSQQHHQQQKDMHSYFASLFLF